MGGAEFLFYTVNGAGHYYPSILHTLGQGGVDFLGLQNQDIESADEIWAFPSNYQLVPETGLISSLSVGLLATASVARRRGRSKGR